MAQTAKTILLRENGNFISPATNIESLYYEVKEHKDNGYYYYRHSVYQHWPVYVNYGNNVESNYGIKEIDTAILDISTITETVVLTNEVGGDKDIIVSRLTNRRMQGTNCYALDVSNYNLSKILIHYAPKVWTNILINEVSLYCADTSLKIHLYIEDTSAGINSSIRDLYNFIDTHVDASIKKIENQINNLENTLKQDTFTYSSLKNLKESSTLVPGYIYRMTYGTPHKFDMYLLADSSSSFSNVVAGCTQTENDQYFKDNKLNKWRITYDFDSSTILYMIDEFNNQCNFDFKNRIVFKKDNEDFSLNANCYNNTVLTNTLNEKTKLNNAIILLSGTRGKNSIANVYIGYNNSIIINSSANISNVYIGNNNMSININNSHDIRNIIIQNNNACKLTKSSNINIGSNNSSICIEGYLYNTITTESQYITIQNNNSNIYVCGTNINIYDSNSNVSIGDESNRWYAKNVVINSSCSSLNILNSDITVGPNYYNLDNTNPSTYYTYLNIISRNCNV